MIVSIPSYRDESVLWTVEECITKASRPSDLSIVVLEQNSTERSCSSLASLAESYGARLFVETIHESLAQGPCFARHRIERRIQSLLESGSVRGDLVFMIDAHTLFASGWDTMIRDELSLLPPRSILSCYPRNFSYPVKHVKPSWTFAKKPVYMESNGLDPNGMFLFKYVLHSSPLPEPVLSKGLGACMLVLPVSILYEAPYLKDVPFLFIGEETCMWAKYFEAGYTVYNPTRDIVQTTFVRKHRANFHREAKASQSKRALQNESLNKVKQFLRMAP
jgi:Glycosyltransferase (GlcNAc)